MVVQTKTIAFAIFLGNKIKISSAILIFGSISVAALCTSMRTKPEIILQQFILVEFAFGIHTNSSLTAKKSCRLYKNTSHIFRGFSTAMLQ